jgi:hypothetical protein
MIITDGEPGSDLATGVAPDAPAPDDDHVCVGLVGGEECHDGSVYGYCDGDRCDGGCEWVGGCKCPCHQGPA